MSYYELSPLWRPVITYKHGNGERVVLYSHRLIPRSKRVIINA